MAGEGLYGAVLEDDRRRELHSNVFLHLIR